MKKMKIIFCCVVSVLIIGFVVSKFPSITMSQSNKDNKEVDFAESTSRSSQNSKIYSSNTEIKYNGENVEEFILSQSLPSIWIVMTDSNMNESKVTLSEEVIEILRKHWAKRLKYEYLRTFVGISKDIDYQKEDTIILQSFIDTKDSLTKISIISEDGSRKFSSEEAYQLLGILRDSSQELGDEIKKAKNKQK